MLRRASILAWVVSIAVLVYGVLSYAAVRRAIRVACPSFCIHGEHRWHPRPNEDTIFGVSPADVPTYLYFGPVRVRLSVLIMSSLTIQSIPFVCAFADWHRRRKRDRNNWCLECGYKLERLRGRCPRCRVRVGPDERVYRLTTR